MSKQKFKFGSIIIADVTINIDKTEMKRKKDILEDMAIEDLFSELLRAKIIRNYPIIFLRDWFGDLSYQNYEARREFRDYKHRLGEVKQLVLEYCVLPLISKETHKLAPLVRSVCIYGLPRAGKTSLANAICSEVSSLFSYLMSKDTKNMLVRDTTVSQFFIVLS